MTYVLEPLLQGNEGPMDSLQFIIEDKHTFFG